MGKSKRVGIFEASRSIVGSEMKIGGQSRNEGLDCLSMLHIFFEKVGINLPKEWNNYRYEDYKELYDRGDWKELYLSYLRSLGEVLKIEAACPGDIAVMQTATGEYAAGIIVGNGQVIVASKNGGVRPWPTRIFKMLEVIRVG